MIMYKLTQDYIFPPFALSIQMKTLGRDRKVMQILFVSHLLPKKIDDFYGELDF